MLAPYRKLEVMRQSHMTQIGRLAIRLDSIWPWDTRPDIIFADTSSVWAETLGRKRNWKPINLQVHL
jgi:hypothetical protein